MSKFELGHNVPEKYSYLFSRKEVKAIARELADIDNFSYEGISPHDQVNANATEIWLGYVTGTRVGSSWNFSLRLYANRTAFTQDIQDFCAETLVSDASKWVQMQLNQPESFPDGSNSLYIAIKKINGKYRPNSSELKKTQWKLA